MSRAAEEWMPMKVIIIVANGLRPSEMGPYGNEWLPTPYLDRLASESIVFDQHFLDSPSSALQARLGFAAADASSAIAWPGDVQFIAYENLMPPWAPAEEFLEEQFADWEFDEDPEPWLDPVPGTLDAGDRVGFERLRRSLAAALRQFDNWLGDVVAARGQNDLLILTSPRGQYLGEHGIVGDLRPWLFEELVHLPLIIRLPKNEQRGRRVWHLTQSTDIAPTVFDALGLAVPESWHGKSLLPLCRGGGPFRDFVAMAHSRDDASEVALQSPEVKVILPTKTPPGDPPRPPMFFVKPDDRWDVNDLRQQNLDYAEQLERTLLDYVAAAQRPGPLLPPTLPLREMTHGDRETGGRELNAPESQSGI
jgi:arylsulfatase A-like enzyme